MEVNEVADIAEVSLFEKLSSLGHEQVVFCHDQPTGLKAIIGIHSTVLGPSMGGTRMWNYESEQEALKDVLRLSRGMTYKAAITGLKIGGGKAVIIGDARKIKNEAFMRMFGKFVNSLGGKYYTAEDVNMSTRDMQYVAMETKYVTGLPISMGGGGDPSLLTAYGTYMGIKGTAKKVYGSDSLEGKVIAVQGVGHVGTYLVEHLLKENAKVYVSDIFENKLREITSKFKVDVVEEEEIYDLDMNVYSPCALGATLNDDTINRLKCDIVAGAANNQLANEKKHGYMIMEKGIVYAPDFLINAGGLINVYMEYLGGYNQDKAFASAEKIYDTCQDIYKFSEKHNIPAQEAAIQIAKKRIEDIGKSNSITNK